MKIRLIAVNTDNKGKATGFRLLDSDSGQIMDQPYDKVLAVLNNKVPIVGLKVERGKVIGSNGSIDRYPTFVNGNLTKKAVIIIATIDNVGYRVCNHEGKISDTPGDEIIKYCNNIRAQSAGFRVAADDALGIANGKIVTKDGKQYISSIVGNYDNIPLEQSSLKDKLAKNNQQQQKPQNNQPEKTTITNSSDSNTSEDNQASNTPSSTGKEIVDKRDKTIRINRSNNPRYPVIVPMGLVTDRMKEIDEKCGMSLEDKWARAVLAIRDIRPFYYAILMTIKQREASAELGVPTMGVSTDTLFYNPDFVKEVTNEELIFILLHEICHIAMLHRARENGREHDGWNTVTDLYINKNLADEFCLGNIPGTVKYANTVAYKDPDTETQYRSKYKIALPEIGLFNSNVNVETDIPEKMYEELMDSMLNQQSNNYDNIDTNKIREGAQQANNEARANAEQAGESQKAQQAESKINEGAQQSTDGSHDIDNGRQMMQEGKEENDQQKMSQGQQLVEQGINDVMEGAEKIRQGQQQMQEALNEAGQNQQSNQQNQQNQQGQQSQSGQQDQGQQGQQAGQNQQSQSGQQGQQGQQGQGQQGQGQQGQGQQGQGQQGQGQQGQGQQGQGQQGQGQGQQGQGQGQQGQGSGAQSGGQSGLDKIYDGMGMSNAQGSSGNNSSQQQGGTGGNSSNGQSNNGSGVPKNYESHEANPGEGKANNETGELGNASSQMKSLGQKGETGDSNYNAEVQRQKGRFEGKEFKGQIIKNGMSNDIVDTTEDTNKSAEEKYRNGQARLRAAVEIAKQMHAYGGDNPGFLERMVEKALAPKVNWRSVLRKFLIKSNKKEYTLSHPDKRFLGQKSTDGKKQVYAGPHKYGGGDLENIKIAIDTSGSITAKDLGVALTQIEDMFKKYNAHAELIYWDTRVRAVYEFDKVEELLKKEPMGGGGTDVNCVFDYFESAKEYKMHRKPKPSLVLIFTDGYFGEVNKAYSKKYKNTIWILHDNDDFKAPFGIIAPFKISDM